MPQDRPASKKRLSLILLVFLLLFIGATGGGYLFFSKKIFKYDYAEKPGIPETEEDITTLNIYYPVQDALRMEERRIKRRISPLSVAEAVVDEFLKGPAGETGPGIPREARRLGVSFGTEGILYVDLSDEFRSNFMGDAMDEFLVLRGLYESLISNVPDIRDVKVLVDHKEIETLGGHILLLYPLGETISSTVKAPDSSPEGGTANISNSASSPQTPLREKD